MRSGKTNKKNGRMLISAISGRCSNIQVSEDWNS